MKDIKKSFVNDVTPKRLLAFKRTTRRYIPEDRTLLWFICGQKRKYVPFFSKSHFEIMSNVRTSANFKIYRTATVQESFVNCSEYRRGVVRGAEGSEAE
jgi:hypothetical protein